MSSRVSRLAELRRQRDSNPNSNPSDAVGVQKANSDSPASKVSEQEAISSALPKTTPAVNVPVNVLENVSIGKPVEDLSVLLGSSLAENPQLASEEQTREMKVTYNSDLKKDLSHLLNRARIDTDRVLYEIKWQSYQEDQAD